jgi:DNA-binding winged helix-turn-helix (wHTH) protein
MPATPIVSFGPFRLNPTERRLERNDEAVVLGSRSLELLIALVERAGEILSHRELMARVWPDVVVEASNLRVHVTRLRKALGDGKGGARCVANVPGRGYCLVAAIQWFGAATPRAAATTDTLDPRPRRLPPGAGALGGAGGDRRRTVDAAAVPPLRERGGGGWDGQDDGCRRGRACASRCVREWDIFCRSQYADRCRACAVFDRISARSSSPASGPDCWCPRLRRRPPPPGSPRWLRTRDCGCRGRGRTSFQ